MDETATRDMPPAEPVWQDLRARVQAHYGARLACLVLFGSQARGDAVPGSDVDVLVVLHDGEQPGDRDFARELTADLMMRSGYEFHASLMHTSLEHYLHQQSPLMINVRREGVLLTNGEVLSLLHAAMQQPRERTNGMTPEQQALIQKAAESLRGARLLRDDGLSGFAAGRAYYTMFYIAQAFLLSKGLSYSKHSGVISGFGHHIAHPGIVPVEFHGYLIDAQEARLIGDYAPDVALSEGRVATLIARAEAFLDAANRLIT